MAQPKGTFGKPIIPTPVEEEQLIHEDWNERDQRRRERKKARPLPLPGIGEEGAPATGLSARRGHAPGRDNHIRKRPPVDKEN